MSKIFDKIKSVFVVPDDQAKEQRSQSESTQVQTSESASSQVKVTTEMPTNADGARVSEKFMDLLFGALEKNNQAGFDYLEFKKAVQSVAKINTMDESTQFRTAFAAAQAMNVIPGQLIQSAKTYLSILETEKNNFNLSASNYLKSQVSTKEQESQSLAKSINDKKNQIIQLQKELEQQEKRLSEISSEIETARSKVAQNTNDFSASYNLVVDQIKQDIGKMENYLK